MAAYQADQSARDTNSYNSQTFKNNRQLAVNESVNSHEAMIAQVDEENQVSASEIASVRLEGDLARAAAATGSLESGASGLSSQAIQGDLTRQETAFVETTRRNSQFRDEQFERTSSAVQTQTQGRIESARRAKVARPLFLNSALQVGSAGLNAGVSVHAARGGFLPKPA